MKKSITGCFMQANHELREKASKILKILISHGYEAYFVGGYVRDNLLQRQIKDIDIATNALPEAVMTLFPRSVPTGVQHGTVTVIVDGTPFEVTTFRAESEYVQYRRPKEVRFIQELKADLERRDFTINAMAIDVNDRLIDPFGGRDDLRQRLLRCVGDPLERFREDALRMMRCIRFAAEYQLRIDNATWQAVVHHKEALEHIAMERIRMEMEKIIEGRFPSRGLRLLLESGLYRHFKGGLTLPLDKLQDSDFHTLENISELTDDDTKWVVLLLCVGLSSEDAQRLMELWTFSKKRAARIYAPMLLNEKLSANHKPLEEHWKVTALEYGKDAAGCWLEAVKLVNEHHPDRDILKLPPDTVRLLLLRGREWLNEMKVEHVRDLRISGNDISKLFTKPGPWISETQRELLKKAATGKVENEFKALLRQAKIYVGETYKQ
jgi:tRNA nucleotidyltransferase (CCA-adding enzyme)